MSVSRSLSVDSLFLRAVGNAETRRGPRPILLSALGSPEQRTKCALIQRTLDSKCRLYRYYLPFRWGFGSSLQSRLRIAAYFFQLNLFPYHQALSLPIIPASTSIVTMVLACLWSVLSLGALGCEPQRLMRVVSRGGPTLAPSATRIFQKEKTK